MQIRDVLALASFLCAAAVTPAVGQQALDSTRVATSSARSSSHAATQLGPRVSPSFQSFEPRLAPRNASASLAGEGDQHVIVVSTLALVLGIIIIVLLIAR